MESSLGERVDEDELASNQENKGQSESDKPAFSIDEKTEGNLNIVIERRRFDTKDSDIEYTEATIPMSTFESRPDDVVRAIVSGVEDVLSDLPFTLDSALGKVENKGVRTIQTKSPCNRNIVKPRKGTRNQAHKQPMQRFLMQS